MMGKFKKYEKYRNSGHEWIVEIPSDWEMIRTKFLFSERVQKGFPNKLLLAATQTKGVVKKADYETRTVTAQKDFHLLKLVKVGDFVISLRSFQGGIEISYEEGIISPAYTIMTPSVKVEKNYIKHLFKSKFFILSLNRFVTGIREGQNIDYKKFKNSFLPVPPLSIQNNISNFLDEKIKQIDHFIQLKEKTIALLQERKAAIINQAVTKGLDLNVPMKDSGIEWLGKIPEHWEVKSLKYLSRLQSGIAISPKNIPVGDRGIPYLRVANVQDGYLNLSKVKKIAISSKLMKRFLLKRGDLLMNEGGDYDKLGRGYVWENEIEPCLHQNHVYAIRMNHNINPYWINYTTLSFYAKSYFKSKAKKTTNLASISTRNIREYPVLFPPKEEQNQIMGFLRIKKDKYALSISQINKEITLIKEYRASLISAAVTGKIDVNYQKRGAKTEVSSVEST